jgi:hypothetical protein
LETNLCSTDPVYVCLVCTISFSLWFHVLCGGIIYTNKGHHVGLFLQVERNRFLHLL